MNDTIQVGDTVKIIGSPRSFHMYSGGIPNGISGFGLSPNDYNGRIGVVQSFGMHGSEYAVLRLLNETEIMIAVDEIEKLDA